MNAQLVSLSGLRDNHLLEATAKLRTAYDLPRRVFVTLPKQKPFFCDFECLLSMEVLAHEMRSCDGTITFTEMSPRPEELWLDFGAGPHTSELRFVASLDGDKFAGK